MLFQGIAIHLTILYVKTAGYTWPFDKSISTISSLALFNLCGKT